jgi:hypothetical protein
LTEFHLLVNKDNTIITKLIETNENNTI